MRAVEFYDYSLLIDINRRITFADGRLQVIVDELYPEYDAVRCTRPAEFNFLIDKVKLGKLQCFPLSGNVVNKPIMGVNMKSTFSEGDYYLVTNSDVESSLGKNGTRPYIDGNALAEGLNFQ